MVVGPFVYIGALAGILEGLILFWINGNTDMIPVGLASGAFAGLVVGVFLTHT